ncbi:ABC transporter permease subunit [Streptomyces spirodelae]|uniref:ABC transporter permease n=1 Tax=Streptomyces spirodelae TaxID=2812904 RepID=A0ABS3WRN9_9ACTN|nr:ABC transporter permease subunit [Streptomyces spirodelae]MBO8185788.1 ABC transporter permease [Streptomyces spirodelae]
MSTQQYEGQAGYEAQAVPQANWPNGIAPYSSPIPMARTHLGHALVAEWTKIRTVRSTVWTLSVMFALVVGIGLLTAGTLSGETYTGMPLLSTGLFGLMLGQLGVVTLGVLVITSEYGTGMIRTTLTACPHRGRVLLAKALVFFVLAFAMTTLACSLTALVNSALLSDQQIPSYVEEGSFGGTVEGGTLVASSGEWLGATIGAGLYVALLGLLSLAVGALLRHSAGAITTMMGAILLPVVVGPLMQTSEALRDVGQKLVEYSPLNGLASLYRIPMSDDQDATGWPLLGGLAVVTLIVLGVAYALLHKRDV